MARASQGVAGVLSRVAGIDGGRVGPESQQWRTQAETDKGHWALCPGSSFLPPGEQLLEAGLSVAAAVAARPGGYTAVHTVLTVNSASLAMMSVGWMLRSYMGFSNVARTFVFSWPA